MQLHNASLDHFFHWTGRELHSSWFQISYFFFAISNHIQKENCQFLLHTFSAQQSQESNVQNVKFRQLQTHFCNSFVLSWHLNIAFWSADFCPQKYRYTFIRDFTKERHTLFCFQLFKCHLEQINSKQTILKQIPCYIWMLINLTVCPTMSTYKTKDACNNNSYKLDFN